MKPTNPSSSCSFDFTSFPTKPGVYLMKNAKADILYVGKAINLRARIKSYFIPGRDGRLMIPYLIKQIHSIDTIVLPTEKEALVLENTLIKTHKPKYNILLKDDKTFLSLMLNTSHRWPMLKVTRLKGRLPQKDLYFGPYTNAHAARQTLELLLNLFPLRQCSDFELASRTRPCILYDMKKCIAPCCHKCTKQQYDQIVDQIISFLKGKDRSIVQLLTQQMHAASERLDFELAARLHKLIQSIKTTLRPPIFKTERDDMDILALARLADTVVLTRQEYREGQLIHSQDIYYKQVIQENEEVLTSFLLQQYEATATGPKLILLSEAIEAKDVVADLIHKKIEVPKKGDRKKLVEIALLNAKTALEHSKDKNLEAILLSLEEKLQLTYYPEHIECIDQSHLSGSLPVSALVTFINGVKAVKQYRTYKLKATDDYGGLQEVLQRRFQDPTILPDLLLIDGGLGHLNTALKVLSELNISTVDVVAIAKQESRHDKGSTQEKLFLPHLPEPLLLPIHSQELFFLQRIRDEAHRFVLKFQTKQRSKTQFLSELDQLEGIGPIKKKRLLSHFGSIKRIKQATEEQWKEIKGLTTKDITTLKRWKSTKES